MNAQIIKSKVHEYSRLRTELREFIRNSLESLEAGNSEHTAEEYLSIVMTKKDKIDELETDLRISVADNRSVVVADLDDREILRKLLKRSPSEKAIARMLDADLEDDYYDDDFEAMLQLSYLYPPKKYFEDKLGIGGILTKIKTPERLQRFLHEAVEAYALGLQNSLIALCRAMLEVSVFDCAISRNFIPQNCYKWPNYKQYPPVEVFRRATEGNKTLRTRARSAYMKYSPVVHGQEVAAVDMKKELLETLRTIELVYEHNFK